jgi:hypothetical protein
LTCKAPNSEPGWCFKFRAKSCIISIGHTFCPIELKVRELPIWVIKNRKKYQKNKSKKYKIWISTSGLTSW